MGSDIVVSRIIQIVFFTVTFLGMGLTTYAPWGREAYVLFIMFAFIFAALDYHAMELERINENEKFL